MFIVLAPGQVVKADNSRSNDLLQPLDKDAYPYWKKLAKIFLQTRNPKQFGKIYFTAQNPRHQCNMT